MELEVKGMAEKTKQVDSIKLLADIKKCCEKHGVRLAALRFTDEINPKDYPSFQFVKIETVGVYKIGENEDKEEC